MSFGVEVTGVKETEEALKLTGEKIKLGADNGLFKAGLLIQRESQLKTPVDLGNLKASAFTISVRVAHSQPFPNFDGEDAGEMTSDHIETLAEAKRDIIKDDDPKVIVGHSANYALYVHLIVTGKRLAMCNSY